MIYSTVPRRRRASWGGYGAYGDYLLDPGIVDTGGTPADVIPDLATSDVGGTTSDWWSGITGVIGAGTGLLKTMGVGTSPPSGGVGPAPPIARSTGMFSGPGNTTTSLLLGGGVLVALMLFSKKKSW